MLTFLPYIVAGVVALGVLGTTYYKGRVAGREAATAELKPLLEACQGREKALGTQIEAQNTAVRALEAAGKARQARASAGIAAARSDAQKAQIEAQRLREAILAPVDNSCEAAVGQVRKGLK